jgi:hypothetical protein
LLSNDIIAWERWTFKFAEVGLLRNIVPYVPIGRRIDDEGSREQTYRGRKEGNYGTVDDMATGAEWHGKGVRLPSFVYELILEHLMLEDPKLFLETIKRWGRPSEGGTTNRTKGDQYGSAEGEGEGERPQELYTMSIILSRLEAALLRRQDRFLREAQAELFLLDRQFSRAVDGYLLLAQQQAASKNTAEPGSPSYNDGPEERRDFAHVFRLIEREGLWTQIMSQVPRLVQLSRLECVIVCRISFAW